MASKAEALATSKLFCRHKMRKDAPNQRGGPMAPLETRANRVDERSARRENEGEMQVEGSEIG